MYIMYVYIYIVIYIYIYIYLYMLYSLNKENTERDIYIYIIMHINMKHIGNMCICMYALYISRYLQLCMHTHRYTYVCICMY